LFKTVMALRAIALTSPGVRVPRTRSAVDDRPEGKASALVMIGGMLDSSTEPDIAHTSCQSCTDFGNLTMKLLLFFGSVKNQSIGIPATVNVTNLKAHNGILSKAYYREYEIPSNAPVAVRMVYGDGSLRCDPMVATFVPQPGADHEGYLQGEGHSFKVVMTTASGTPMALLFTGAGPERSRH
jgi:hypothetical protein